MIKVYQVSRRYIMLISSHWFTNCDRCIPLMRQYFKAWLTNWPDA